MASSRIPKTHYIRCEASLEEKQIIATPDQATALFRILQEILTNVARHSQAPKSAFHSRQKAEIC